MLDIGFSSKLRTVRREKQMTRRELATRSCLCVYTIRAYERGLRRPTMGSLKRLFKGLGLTQVEINEFQTILIGPLMKTGQQWLEFNKDGSPKEIKCQAP